MGGAPDSTRRRTTRTAALAAALAGALAATGAGGPPVQAGAEDAPNVVVIQTDDQTYDSMRFMRRTRSLIGERGATFTRHYANYPLCCPSRATLLTGQYAHNHGVLDNTPPEGGYEAFDNSKALPVWLDDAGYLTAHVGKFLNRYGHVDPVEVPVGWDEWFTPTGGTTQTVYGYVMNDNGELVEYGETPKDFKGDVLTRRAVELVTEHAGGPDPLYLQLDYTAPHSGPPDPNPQPPGNCQRSAKPAPRHANAFDDLELPEPPNFNEADVSDKPLEIRQIARLDERARRYVRRHYRCRAESLLHVDEGVADVVAALRESGELANTYVIFTSDNGFFHGEHRVRLGKTRVYEPSVHVPLLVRGPGIPAGVRVRELTVNADVPATVLELTGAEAGVPQDGMSLLPFAGLPRRERGRELLFETLTYSAIRTGRYLWVEHSETGETELYDMRTDPWQLRSRHASAAYATARERLAERLAQLRDCAGASCRELPELAPVMSASTGAGGCLRTPVTFTFEGADATELDLAELLRSGQPVAVDGTEPFELRLRRRHVGRARSVRLEVRAMLLDGRELSWQRGLRICRA
jgi:N-acetylglucosamine-6-sulfatase